MYRLLIAFVLLSVLPCELARAAIFKCERADGTVIFTDDPSQAPSDCKVQIVKDLPPLGVLPFTSQVPASGQKGAKSELYKGEVETARSYDSYMREADQLISQYQAVRYRVVHSSFVKDQLAARKELGDIKAQAGNLISEIEQSTLSFSDKKELNDLLSSITE